MSAEAAGSAAWEMGRRTDGPLDLGAMLAAFRWQVDAACKGAGCEDFFPERGEGLSNHGNAAKAVCARCPVIEECLVSSLENHEECGIWAGAGEGRRRVLSRAWNRREDEPELWERIRDDHLTRARLYALPSQERRAALRAMGPAPMLEGRGINATGQSHGRRSTYSRGCRCVACRWTVAPHVGLLRRAKVDTAALWADHAPEGWEEMPAAEVLEVVDRAALVRLLEPDVLSVPEVWAWLVGLERDALASAYIPRSQMQRRWMGRWLLAALDGDRLVDRWPASYPGGGEGLSEAA